MSKSTDYRIDDHDGHVTNTFFGSDWNADCTVNNTFKYKSADGTGLKFTHVKIFLKIRNLLLKIVVIGKLNKKPK